MNKDPSTKRAARPRRGRPHRVVPTDTRRGRTATQARLVAVRVLERVQRTGAFADLALHHALARSDLSVQDRALCTELVYGSLRWRGRLDFVLAARLERDLTRLEPLVASTLRLGAYQILFCDRIPDGAAVDQSVRCARILGAERATGLVNAVLRRLAAERHDLGLPGLENDPLDHLQHALSLPRWLARRWLGDLGPKEAAALARASNDAPPVTVRVNRLRSDPVALLAELRERFPEAQPGRFAPDALVLGHRGHPGRDPAFHAGRMTVQDEASQLVVEMLDPRAGERVLDVCAAPGAKATALGERVGGEGRVVAGDRHGRRLALVGRDARRLGIDWLRTAERDATAPLDDLVSGPEDPGPFDRVLVDAPCSGLGTLRRNPDARWRLRPEDPAALAAVQGQILRRAAAVLRVGGRLVYATCTLLPEENEQVVQSFLDEQEGFHAVEPGRLPSSLASLLDDRGVLRTWPHRHDCDGFTAVALERRR